MVFVDQAGEDIGWPNRWAKTRAGDDGGAGGRRPLIEGSVRAMPVVVGLVLGQDSCQLSFVEDQQPIQAFAADGADPPLGVGVRLRGAWWATEYWDLRVSEHVVEAGGERRIAIPDQEPETAGPLPAGIRKVRACWVTQSPVGCRVTLRMWTWREPTSTTKIT